MHVNTNQNDSVTRILTERFDVEAMLDSGELKEWGGVLRYPKGHPKAGQIHSHILFPGDQARSRDQMEQLKQMLEGKLGQMQGSMDAMSAGMGQLQESMDVIKGMQQANLVMSAVNLAVSVAGFAIVCNKLSKVSDQIQAQGEKVDRLLGLASMAHERAILRDESNIHALINTARQHCATNNAVGMSTLILPFQQEYQFNLRLLQNLSFQSLGTAENVANVKLMQARLVNIGMVLAHLQLRMDAANEALGTVKQLSASIVDLNARRVQGLTEERKFAASLTHEHIADVKALLVEGKNTLPKLHCEATLLQLEVQRPGAMKEALEADEIIVLKVA